MADALKKYMPALHGMFSKYPFMERHVRGTYYLISLD
jgi:hypothetical protein